MEEVGDTRWLQIIDRKKAAVVALRVALVRYVTGFSLNIVNRQHDCARLSDQRVATISRL